MCFFKLEFKPGVGGGFLRAFASQKGPGKGLPAAHVPAQLPRGPGRRVRRGLLRRRAARVARRARSGRRAGSSSPPNQIALLLKFTVADRRPGPPPTGGGGPRASPRSRCRRGSRPAPARMSGAAPRSGPTRRWARGRASRGVQRYIPSRPAGRRRSSRSAAARTGRAVMSCVEIKFRAPHAIDAMLSP